MATRPENGWRRAVRILWPMAATLLVYGQTLGFDLLWDDPIHFAQFNPPRGALGAELRRTWSEPFAGMFIPLTYSLWNLIGRAFDYAPSAYHAANLIVHAANGILVAAILRRLVRREAAVVVGTLVFLWHPLQAESVAWVSEMRGLLSAFFGFAGIVLSLSLASESRRYKRLLKGAAAIVAFGLALLAKPFGIVFPLLAIILRAYLARLNEPKAVPITTHLRSLIAPLAAFALIVVPFGHLTSKFQMYAYRTPSIPLWARPVVWADAIHFYMSKILIPYPLLPAYGRLPEKIMVNPLSYVALLAPLGVGMVVWRERQRQPLLSLAYVVFLAGFLPVSGLVSFEFQRWSTVADRYMYVALLGPAIALAYHCASSHRRHVTLAWVVVVGLFGALNAGWQTPVWRDELTLWNHSIAFKPDEPRAYLNRGMQFYQRRDYEAARRDYDRAIALDPQTEKAYLDRGALALDLGDLDAALADFNQALALDPTLANAYSNRGIIAAKRGQYDAARRDFDASLRLDPGAAKTYNNRGILLSTQSLWQEARADFSRAIELDPDFGAAYFNRGQALLSLKLYREALSDLKRAAALGIMVKPELLDALEKLPQ